MSEDPLICIHAKDDSKKGWIATSITSNGNSLPIKPTPHFTVLVEFADFLKKEYVKDSKRVSVTVERDDDGGMLQKTLEDPEIMNMLKRMFRIQ